MGEVYLAEDTGLGRRIALKRLLPELAADEERRARFEREARAVAAINHPNIVTLYSIERDGDVHFLTMELVGGETISKVIPPGGMPLKRFFEIAVPLTDAVSAAHEHGVTHRDLKPENVMVAPRAREGARLRTGQAETAGVRRRGRHARPERRADDAWTGARDDRLHVAGAGRRARNRSSVGHFFARHNAARDADRTAAVRRGIDRLDRLSLLRDNRLP